MKVRASGVLLHISSLPSGSGVGDLGPWAYRFVDFLHALGQTYWQILPLGPTSTFIGNSPYSCSSAFAGNPLFISADILMQTGVLNRGDINDFYEHDPRRADYLNATSFKDYVLKEAFERSYGELGADFRYKDFCAENASWLDDFVLFTTLKRKFNGALWAEWPQEFRDRNPDALAAYRREAAPEILYESFAQYLFFSQWRALKDYANGRGVRIIGDMPIYVTYDSADVWAHPEIFKLDERKQSYAVAGVPPDYFSETGQRWGNPVYDWDKLKEQDYAWWVHRMEHNLSMFDFVRLDHFRGFAQYWEIDAEEETAVNGDWEDGPGQDFFNVLFRKLPAVPLIAEDLGVITADVTALKDRYGFPGMKVLVFAFGADVAENFYAPHNYEKNCVVYSGTHDNNTVAGWFYDEASVEDRRRVLEYCGACDGSPPHEALIRLAMRSTANTAIFPVQDLLGYGSEHRMNTPAVAKGNWGWRMLAEEMDPSRLHFIKEMTTLYGRI